MHAELFEKPAILAIEMKDIMLYTGVILFRALRELFGLFEYAQQF